MTIAEANEVLVKARNDALVRHANVLLASGASIDSELFRNSMATYLEDLERWRANAMTRIHKLVAEWTAPQTGALQ